MYRQLRRLRREVGLSPKRFARLARFRSAIDRLATSTLATVAVECGYADQSHLTHEFRGLAGTTPSAYRATLYKTVGEAPSYARPVSDIIPVIPYQDIPAAHDFLVTAFGFTSAGLNEHDGEVIRGEVQLDGHRIWLHAAVGGLSTPKHAGADTGVYSWSSPTSTRTSPPPRRLAPIISEPTDRDYGQREYGVRDREGHSCSIATPLCR